MALDVLIVDDSAAIRKILQRVLVQADVALGNVHEANDGREALEKLKTTKVGLILSDINMPNMDGLELLGKIRAKAEWQAFRSSWSPLRAARTKCCKLCSWEQTATSENLSQPNKSRRNSLAVCI